MRKRCRLARLRASTTQVRSTGPLRPSGGTSGLRRRPLLERSDGPVRLAGHHVDRRLPDDLANLLEVGGEVGARVACGAARPTRTSTSPRGRPRGDGPGARSGPAPGRRARHRSRCRPGRARLSARRRQGCTRCWRPHRAALQVAGALEGLQQVEVAVSEKLRQLGDGEGPLRVGQPVRSRRSRHPTGPGPGPCRGLRPRAWSRMVLSFSPLPCSSAIWRSRSRWASLNCSERPERSARGRSAAAW